MKIYVSKIWIVNIYFMFAFIILIALGTTAFCLWSRSTEDYIIILSALVYELILIGLIVKAKRFTAHVVVDGDKLNSYSFFGKKFCTIDTKKQIYYAEFNSREGAILKGPKFVAFSNEPFEYQPSYGRAKISFFHHYNMNKLIVLPYEKALRFIEPKKWSRVN